MHESSSFTCLLKHWAQNGRCVRLSACACWEYSHTNQWNSFITPECLILGINPLNTGTAGRHKRKVRNSVCVPGLHRCHSEVSGIVFQHLNLGTIQKTKKYSRRVWCSLIQRAGFITLYLLYFVFVRLFPSAPNAAKQYEHQSASDSFYPPAPNRIRPSFFKNRSTTEPALNLGLCLFLLHLPFHSSLDVTQSCHLRSNLGRNEKRFICCSWDSRPCKYEDWLKGFAQREMKMARHAL